ncbi:formimidoyltransferase-cyclodeaminase-like [Ptychodera flava]|uniref:formimidoyltransferase-cyclodeaminase-like n=1 Tax=Ptychodera flava TaxID=63121 RepID=UPI00396A7E0F
MSRIVECVPNFSEGQSKEVIEAIANAIGSTEGVSLLDVDPGLSTNRTVYTFVGSPDTIVEGALNAARVAYQTIDMTRHTGEHPRMGALDVCPFIPVRGVTMEDCVLCAKEFGERLAGELGVPVYLYGYAATDESRRTLPQIRAGEYEALPEKLQKPEWKPDFGPAEFVPTWGATVTGARKFLIAYNVNLLSTKEQAHRIALNIREQGRGAEEPGRLKNVQAIGWYLEESNLAQVSTNLTDFEITPMHTVFEEVSKDARELNWAVCGSQVVGLIPLKAVMMAADYYCEKENLFILEEDQKIRLVVNRLGLSALGSFNPKERIIEYMIRDDSDGPLVSMSLRSFILNIGARSSAPGGGSAAAAMGSMGAALGSMVGWMTYGNKKFYPLEEEMRKLIPPLHHAMHELIPMVDADTTAFNQYMAACKLPRVVKKRSYREQCMQSSLKTAVAVPMHVAVTINKCWPSMKDLAAKGNIQCRSDVQVGARALETALWGAYYNVMINLPDLKDEEFKNKAKTDIEEALKLAQESCAEVLKVVEERKE